MGRRAMVTGAATVGACLSILAGCTGAPNTSKSSIGATTTAPKSRSPGSTTSSTSTTSPPATPTTAAVSTDVQVTVSGSSATIAFNSANVVSSVSTSPGTFSQGGTVFTFSIAGVEYTGTPATTDASGGLIASVVVASAHGGATVTVRLTSAASHASFGISHDEVGFQLS